MFPELLFFFSTCEDTAPLFREGHHECEGIFWGSLAAVFSSDFSLSFTTLGLLRIKPKCPVIATRSSCTGSGQGSVALCWTAPQGLKAICLIWEVCGDVDHRAGQRWGKLGVIHYPVLCTHAAYPHTRTYSDTLTSSALTSHQASACTAVPPQG